ncbi:hypothetical protein [Streptomyces venezuelae]|uniref:hypothetical protein n=1 Tax=Streptomyces venezuelae TaxID=54571 RepID=UPI003430F301
MAASGSASTRAAWQPIRAVTSYGPSRVHDGPLPGRTHGPLDEQYDGTPAAVLTTPAGVFAVVTTDVDPEGDCPHITAVRTIRQAKSAGDRLLALRL